MSFRVNAVTAACVMVLSMGSTGGPAALAEGCPLSIDVELNEWLVLYDSAPEPWWFFPLVVSTVEEVGIVGGGQRVRICESAKVSTWNHRWLWVRIDSVPGEQYVAQGWMQPRGWVRAGETDVSSFLARQRRPVAGSGWTR